MSSKDLVVSGDFGGGGGGGGSHTPIEANDTLSSKQRLRMLFVVGEGEIDNISEVYVNDTPIAGFDASYEVRTGTVDQTVISGFSEVETPVTPAINTILVAGSPVVREVSSNVVDAVRVTIRINSLFRIKENGDTVGHSVSVAVMTRRDANDIFTVQHTITKTDKGSSPYKMDIRVQRPANAVGQTWQVGVERVSLDDNSNRTSSPTYFDNLTEIQEVSLTYPHSGLVGLVFNNADQLGGNIPTISFNGKFVKVNVPDPSVYDPVNRTYTGASWSGAFALNKYASSCVAWVLFDVLTNTRYGLGISLGHLNLFSFLDFAIECDELVDDGKGNNTFEPRFSINNQFYRRDNAPTFLTFLLTLGNAKLANDEFGLISVISDRPKIATKIVNNANVIDGLFDYPSSELDETFSWVNVTFNDPDDKHNTTTISEKRQDRIDKFGLIPSDIVLVGCTSEGQARRKAIWALNAPEGSTIFKVGLEGLIYHIGEVIQVMDEYKKNVLQQGRILSASSDANFTTVTLDRELDLASQSYSLICYSADALTVYEAAILESNIITNTVTASLPGPLLSDPDKESPFIISGDIEPALYRVMDIERDEDVFTVLATIEDENKRGIIENGLVNRIPNKAFVNIEGFVVEPIVNVVFNEVFAVSGVANLSRINVTWDWDLDGSSDLVARYQYSWRRDNLPFSAIQSIDLKQFEIPDVTPGIYEVVITAFNPRGVKSSPVSAIYSYRVVSAQSSLKPPLNLHVVNTSSNVFQTRDLSISWFYDVVNDDRTLVNDSLLDYVIEIWSAGILKNSYTVQPTASKNGLFTYTFQDNQNDHGTADRSVEVRVYCRDIVGDLSIAITNTFINPVPPVVSFTLLAGTGSTYVNISTPSDPDIAGYLVYRDITDNNFIAGAANLKYDGPDNYIALGGQAGVQYFYKVAAYDSFGKNSPNISGGQGSTTLAADVDKFAFTGLSFTPDDPALNSVSWAAGSVSINGASPVSISAGNAAFTSAPLYIYFDKVSVSLGVTIDITVAVTKAQIIAVYNGGQDLNGGDGTAFFNGAQLLAKSVGANELVVDNAIITAAAQIANLIVNNAHLENLSVTSEILATVIQSIGYNQTLKQGWRLDRSSGLTIYDGEINLIGNNAFNVKSAITGARVETTSKGLKVYDANDILRVNIGDLT